MKQIENLIAKDDLVVVTGGGGFIGGHLVADLRRKGYKKLRSVDVKPFDQWDPLESTCRHASLSIL